MYQTQLQIRAVIVVVAVLAVVAGVVIVLVTSPKSLELSDLQPARSQTATAQSGTPAPAAGLTVAATDTPAAPPTIKPLATPNVTVTPFATLPADVRALAIINLTDGASARLRAVPGGDIIEAIPGGATVQLLKQPSRVLDGLTWVQIRDENGVAGWVATHLLVILPSP
ncbi:MAG: SH3 domain-containing protein [Chloroflexi bacterium]|nr:SH3 domain-containing protein [Chloroflexota bacterium]